MYIIYKKWLGWKQSALPLYNLTFKFKISKIKDTLIEKYIIVVIIIKSQPKNSRSHVCLFSDRIAPSFRL
jgi:hypothetical protein